MTRATGKQWERLGKEDPYFGVLTDDEFKLHFYTSGSVHLFTSKRLNSGLVKLPVKSSKFGVSNYVRFRMKSKTVRGMEHVTNILQGE